eukprot:5013584-Alexandrium_andersonii.AAC.1
MGGGCHNDTHRCAYQSAAMDVHPIAPQLTHMGYRKIQGQTLTFPWVTAQSCVPSDVPSAWGHAPTTGMWWRSSESSRTSPDVCGRKLSD